MNILYLIVNQPFDPSIAQFTAKVARQTGASVSALAATSNTKDKQENQVDTHPLNKIFTGINFNLEFAGGEIQDLLNHALGAKPYDMVMMGVARRRKIWPSNFRQLSNKIIRDCPIPIMLVRKVSDRFDRMLICTGGSEKAERMVELSARLAGSANLDATLLSVSSAVPSMYTGLDEMEETVEELLSTNTPLAHHLRTSTEILTNRNIIAEVVVRHGDVVEIILGEAVEGKYDLIVLGASEAHRFYRMLMGNVTQQIINRAPSAVLVFKS